MTIEEAIETIEYARAFNEKNTILMKAWDLIIDYVRAQSVNDGQMKSDGWISVKDRLPSDYEKVLTCDAHGNYHLFTHYHEFKEPFGILENHPRYYQPTHWMPLPEPPEQSKKNR